MNNFLIGYLFGNNAGFAAIQFFIFFLIVSQISFVWNISKKHFWINLVLLFIIFSIGFKPAISIFAFLNPKAIQAALHSAFNPYIFIPLSLFNCLASLLIIVNGFKMMRRTKNGRTLFVKTLPYFLLSTSLNFSFGIYIGMTMKYIKTITLISFLSILILILFGIGFIIYKYYNQDKLKQIFEKA